jgi:D-glycero-alpha-D-manno-heptose 1-phosphate guanylyltransferase
VREVIILAGGLGSRLRESVHDRPKPMADISGRPFLEWQIDALIASGAQRVVLAIGYLGSMIESHFCNGYRGIEIVFSAEEEPLGTGGAVLQALQSSVERTPFIVNGDTFSPYDLDLLARNMVSGIEAVIAAVELGETDRYSLLKISPEDSIVLNFKATGKQNNGLVNTGTYCLDKDRFLSRPWPKKFSLESDYFEAHCAERIFRAVRTTPPFIDIGIPQDYDRAQEYIPAMVKRPSVL